MTVHLADGNLLIALVVADHVHHERALDWFDTSSADLATCPITEGTLLRFLLREGRSAAEAVGALDAIRSQAWHHFWPADLAFAPTMLAGVIGHRQVTDAYLVALARHRGASVATFDKGLAALHGEDVHLIG